MQHWKYDSKRVKLLPYTNRENSSRHREKMRAGTESEGYKHACKLKGREWTCRRWAHLQGQGQRGDGHICRHRDKEETGTSADTR